MLHVKLNDITKHRKVLKLKTKTKTKKTKFLTNNLNKMKNTNSNNILKMKTKTIIFKHHNQLTSIEHKDPKNVLNKTSNYKQIHFQIND